MDKSKLKRIALPIGIVLLGALIMVALVKMKPTPERSESGMAGLLVETMTAELKDWDITVTGTATVRATQEVSLMPQVSGVVKQTSPGFVEGGFFKKGEVLFLIDNTDYMLALRSAEAVEAQAEVELETIKSRAEIAREEWKIMSGSATGEATGQNVTPNPLVLYEPQMKNAQAARDSAGAKAELARLNLERTIIRAPFDCRVRSKTIDVGQYVKSGSPVAVIAGTDSAEVVIPLERGELEWIDIPGHGATAKGSAVTIEVPGSEARWEGRVLRSAGEVEMKSRMVQVVVQVDDPYGLRPANRDSAPLMNGAFVNVSIKGRRLAGVITVPRASIRDDSTVWTMDGSGLLEIKKVTVSRIEGNTAIIQSGLEHGDEIVLTKVSGAANGMKLRTATGGFNGGEKGAMSEEGVVNAPAPEPEEKEPVAPPVVIEEETAE